MNDSHNRETDAAGQGGWMRKQAGARIAGSGTFEASEAERSESAGRLRYLR